MKVGLTNGCFDLFHEGHFHYLARCKQGCDYLVVALNSDESVKRNKGPARPRQDWGTRMAAVMDTGLVDAVIPFEGRWEPLVQELRPAVVFQGVEYRRGLEETVCIRKVGWRRTSTPPDWDIVPIIFIERLEGYSTSLQIAKLAAKTSG